MITFKIIACSTFPTLPHLGIHLLNIPAIFHMTESAPTLAERVVNTYLKAMDSPMEIVEEEDLDDAASIAESTASTASVSFEYKHLASTPLSESLERRFGVKLDYFVFRVTRKFNLQRGLSPFVDYSWPATSVKQSFVIFLYRKTDSIEDLFAITSNSGWRVVFPFSDYHFPREFVKRALIPTEVREHKKRYLAGDQYASIDYYAFSHLLFQSDMFSQISVLFTSALKPTASMMQLSFMGNGEKRRTSQLPKVQFSLRQIKLLKRLSFDQMVQVVVHASKMIHAETADEIDEEFRFLDKMKPVSPSRRWLLESALRDQIYALITSGKQTNLVFCGPQYDEFQRAKLFQIIRFDDSGKVVFTKQWQREEMYLQTADYIELLLDDAAMVTSDRETFNHMLSRTYFYYECDGRWSRKRSFTDFFHGEVSVQSGIYFKVDAIWYAVDGDYLAEVFEDFKKVLKQVLPSADEDIGFTEKWQKKKALATASKSPVVTDAVGVTTASCDYKGYFTSRDLADFLDIKINAAARIITLLKDKGVIAALKGKPRSFNVADTYKDLDETRKRTILYKHLKEVKEYLEEHYQRQQIKPKRVIKRSRDENDFNVRFQNRPYFIVGDCACVKGIELFDILRYDPSTQTLYFYHNKIGFGQHTRDVCSQIRNAAAILLEARKALSSSSEETRSAASLIFVQLYNALVRNLTEGQKDDFGSEADFLRLFSAEATTKIVFVFGFMENVKTKRELRVESEASYSASKFDSNIARLELILTYQRLRSLGLDLRIVTIEQDASGVVLDDASQESQALSLSLPDWFLSQGSSSSSLSSPIVVGRAGVNDCWLTPFLLTLLFSPLKDILLGLNLDGLVPGSRKNLLMLIQKFLREDALSDKETVSVRRLLKELKWIDSLSRTIDPYEILDRLLSDSLDGYAESLDMCQIHVCDATEMFSPEARIPVDEDAADAVSLSQHLTHEDIDGRTQVDYHFSQRQVDDIRWVDTHRKKPCLKLEGVDTLPVCLQSSLTVQEEMDGSRRISLGYVDDGNLIRAQYRYTGLVTTYRLMNDAQFLWVDCSDATIDLTDSVAIRFPGSDVDARFNVIGIIEHQGYKRDRPFVGHYRSYHLSDAWRCYEYGRAQKEYATFNDVKQDICQFQQFGNPYRYRLLLVRG